MGKREAKLKGPGAAKSPRTKFQPSARGAGGSSGDDFGNRLNAVEELTAATAELGLETAYDKREQKGILMWTILIPATVSFLLEGLAEGRTFAEEMKKRKGENIGSAHVRIALRALRALRDMDDWKSDPDFMEALKNFWQEVVEKHSKDPELIEEQIQVWRMTKPKVGTQDIFEGEYGKLVFRLKAATVKEGASEALSEEIIRMARKVGWKVKVGTAPRGPKERKVAEKLKPFQQQ
jgi:hypothetical protein